MPAVKVNKLLTPYNFTNKDDTGRIRYIVLHYTGATGDAEDNCRYFATRYVGASAHYFIGHAGDVWQSVEDGDIAWHCGAKSYKHPSCRNSNSIGIELCVRNKGNKAADTKDWYFEQATVETAAALVKQLMEQYMIPAENVIRHYDVTGKICPNPFVIDETGNAWEEFKKMITECQDKQELVKIAGKAEASAEQMESYIRKVNPDVQQSVIEMIPLYLAEGVAENIRGDIAFAQSCLETGNFTFAGSGVTIDQNNFCGMGVLKTGEKGCSFESPQIGIRAQIQHLKAYANNAKLKKKCVDPRFDYVERGCAAYVQYLGIEENPDGKGWAAGKGYGDKILSILTKMMSTDEDSILRQPDQTDEPKNDTGEYTVKTTVENLNIRSGPGEFYSVVGCIREYVGAKKEYTIVAEQSGWGKLKSGAGWVCLKHVKRTDGEEFHTVKKDVEYKVKTTCNVLNIRAGADAGYQVVGCIKEPQGKKKEYTIIEEKNGWGRLKSGIGWICLKFTEKVS